MAALDQKLEFAVQKHKKIKPSYSGENAQMLEFSSSRSHEKSQNSLATVVLKE